MNRAIVECDEDHILVLIAIVAKSLTSAHTKGDSTLAESSTGNTRLADR